MENLSHSFRHNKLRKSSQANAAANSIYDNVFGGPPKFGVPPTLSPRAEDYKEIFGGFHAPRVSSIPVLDLQVVDEQEVYFDVRSPGFDYSEVFGGFQGLDFADGDKELFGQRGGGSAGCGSSDEAWTLAASESLSEESDHSVSNQCLSNGDSHHLFEENMECNIPYHKANPQSGVEITSGLSCTAEIHAGPGYSYMVDHINPSQMKEKHLKETRLDDLNCRNDVSCQRDYGRINTCPGETFVIISEVSLRTEPSHLPPPSRPPPAASVRDINGPISSSKTGYVERIGDDNSTSLSFFDVEVDASSSAAAVASAAAMKEAMVKAQAQLRSARESMDRKKESRQNRVRMVSSGELRDMGGKHLNEEIVQGTSRGKDSKMENFFMEEPRDVMGMKCAAQDSVEGEDLQNRLKQSAEKVRGKESAYDEMFGNFEEAGEWKEATQFFELVSGDRSGVVLAQTDKQKDVSKNVRTRDNGETEAMIGRFQGQENFNKMKATAEKRVFNENGMEDVKNVNPKAAKEASIGKNIEKTEKAGQDIGQWEEAEKKHGRTHHERITIVKLNESESSEESLNDVFTEVTCKSEVRQVIERKKDELKSKKFSRRLEAENVTGGHGKGYNEKRPKEPFEREEKERMLESVIEPIGNEKRCPELSRQEEKDNRQRENLESAWGKANEREKNEWRLKEAFELEENVKRMREVLEHEEIRKLKEAHEWEKNEKRVKENPEFEENKRKQEAPVREEQERTLKEARKLEAAAREEQERRLKEALVLEENENRLREAHKQAERQKLIETLEQEENEKKLREALEQEEEQMRKEALEKEEKEEKEKILQEALEWEESEESQNEACEKEQMRKRLEEAQQMEENERKLSEAHNLDHTGETIPEAKGREKSENSRQEASQDENGRSNLGNSCMDEKISAKDERDYDEGEVDDASRDTFELEELDKWLKEAVDVEEPNVLNEADKKVEESVQNDNKNLRPDFPASDSGQVLRESRVDADASDDDGDQIRAETQGRGNKFPATENKEDESKNEDSIKSPPLVDRPKQMNLETPQVFSQMSYEFRHQEENSYSQEWGDMKVNTNKSEACFGEGGRRDETPQPRVLNSRRPSRQLQETSQAEGRKENLHGTVKVQEKETETLRREQELEKDRLRKIEEEKEREREREKDRMAIDRATLEARERAYVEARERAERAAVERATAEPRQRSLAEARERLEKACAEARERSFLEKTSVEARIRAEQAAVERVTAEVREQAVSRYNGMRQSSLPSDLHESQHQTAGSSSSRGYQYSSVYGAPYDVENSEGVEGESAQRCRARLERHRRTAERAAKALAEKNMRDLLAQREQAERNRLAETLDADVKRWSSGKEGNLRALLSTLQYILGPDSGWHPVPLTEVITSAAVKKAYRKATLCVHPDKLQQRGASIQQKYICEKVFDLLKEAWNKFSSEER